MAEVTDWSGIPSADQVIKVSDKVLGLMSDPSSCTAGLLNSHCLTEQNLLEIQKLV